MCDTSPDSSACAATELRFADRRRADSDIGRIAAAYDALNRLPPNSNGLGRQTRKGLVAAAEMFRAASNPQRMDQPVTLAREFELESYRIDQLIWDAMALRAGESVLFCGLGNLGWIQRAVAVGVTVSVISNDNAAIRNLTAMPIGVMRGSSTMIPARDATFDATVAFHYLHEVDPFFHANVVSELARVGKRCVVVEPAPPSDPLGLRIAALYSRAKRELGQFENYHHIDYWRKLLAIVKADVTHQTFTFRRTPPHNAMRDTVALIIDTMAAEQTPEPYLTELRALAARSDAQLLPQARHVIVGTAAGKPAAMTAGTEYREPRTEERAPAIVKAFIPPAIANAASATPRVYSDVKTESEFPEVMPPRATPAVAVAPGPLDTPNPLSVAPLLDDGFGISPNPAAVLSEEFGWEWEPPAKETEA